ncbi:MAG: CBS domain-containing protein [Anaerolineales bacterium]|nr:CBS domain-containing protein [Anaerolineales bacterium]
MFVRSYMTVDPIYVSPDDNFHQAMHALRKNKVRHLPVLERGRLVGIVVEKDLLSNQPSPATTLSLYEIYSLLETLRIRQIMSRPVYTVEGDCPLEEAARIMVKHKISCLPVMEGEKLVGIITETDIFRALVEVLGGAAEGTRFVLRVPDKVGELALISDRIAEAGGNILAITTAKAKQGGYGIVMIKETGAKKESLLKLGEGTDVEILDIRHTSQYEPRLFE